MNANELADELKEISLIADNHTKIVLGIAETMLRQQQAEIEELKEKDLRKSMAIRSLNTQLKKALQYKTFSNMAHKNPVKTLEKIGAILRKAQEK